MERPNTPTEALHEPPAEDSLRAGHETRDVNLRAVLWLAAGVVIGAVLVHVGLWVMLQSMKAYATAQDPVLSPLAENQPEPAPPRLQATPMLDYREFREKQEAELESYGWVDKEKERVHIPVSEAMKLILKEGLPKSKPDAGARGDQ